MDKVYELESSLTGLGDEALSLMAIGIMAYLRFELPSKPHTITASELLEAKPNNDRDEVVAALEELQTAGYIKEVN